MKPLYSLDKYRNLDAEADRYGVMGGGNKHGVFEIPRDGVVLRVIADSGEGWDHVSVSTAHRIPTWDEMSFIHRTFFRDDEVAYQFHVPATDHVNIHPYCLHLWRPLHRRVPMPQKSRV